MKVSILMIALNFKPLYRHYQHRNFLNKVLEQKYLFSVPLILLATFFGRFFHFQKLQNIDRFFIS